MSGKLSEEELARLTPEERADWESLDADTTDENLAEIAKEDEDEEPGEEPVEEEPAEEPVEEEPAEEALAEEPAAEEPAAVEVSDDIPEVAFVPRFSGEVLPQYQAQIDALTAKFEEGEIQLSEVLAETRKIEAASRNHEISDQLWEAEQKTFFKHNPDFAPDKNRILCGALNQEVIRLANSKEAAGLSGIQILYAARNSVKQALGQSVVAPKKDADIEKSGKPQEKAKPKAQRPDIKTLGGVPAADADADVGVGKFAHLDSLDGLQLEAAVAKMSPADQAEWLRG